MAHPAHWEKVLATHKDLKLNLAHFGGAGEWRDGRVPNHRRRRIRTGRIRHPSHADMNMSIRIILPRHPAAKNGDAYGQAAPMIHGVEDKVLLGSDWYMSASSATR